MSCGRARRLCGPPVVLRGPARGLRVYPSDVDPDVLVPLFDALEWK